MKREIEFRGKTAKGEWVYGYYVHNTYAVGFAKEPTLYENHYIYSKNFISESWFNTAKVEVIPETVGQYVGIKDKNGKKVYEGDVVSCSYSNCEVVFGLYGVDDYKTVGFFMKVNNALFTNEEDDFIYWGFEDGDKIKVLGNVFDNPELLNKIEHNKESDNGD